ncbi:hypothetical protein P153DRAFT_148038 [Dothidotthia symphoricarpi CBS 119687]|uniref:Uncharacterized protein n=1 Tax=Dothidotthia symphoricarpi CBS 119687 TaxID=1392245 RepID=A0A6A5ZXG5_9PLEO|nr:uncharacterized protein P153DRAFT_148038 [Dothidotthia symphoricarpi CBS 119687]KAF2123715.1 hypothetical protein P153DRAFT_148038 [Dothidotthia symphoricarpi CBS 119687]
MRKTTPPTILSQLPITPPLSAPSPSSSRSCSPCSSSNDAPADPVSIALSLIRTCRSRAGDVNSPRAPEQTRHSVVLSTAEHDSLRTAIDSDTSLRAWVGDRLRSSWTAHAGSGRFVVRMPNPIHDLFALQLQDAIHKRTRRLAKGKEGVQPAIADVQRLQDILRLGTADARRGKEQKSADAGFGVPHSARLLVAIEVGYSQDAASLQKTVGEWLKLGANAVLLVNIAYANPSKRKASATAPITTYTLHRVERYRDVEGTLKKRMVKTQTDVDIAQSANDYLELCLADFCLPTNPPATNYPIRLGHDVMIGLLQTAFARQQVYDEEPGFSSDAEIDAALQIREPTRSSKRNKADVVAVQRKDAAQQGGDPTQDAAEDGEEARNGDTSPKEDAVRENVPAQEEDTAGVDSDANVSIGQGHQARCVATDGEDGID